MSQCNVNNVGLNLKSIPWSSFTEFVINKKPTTTASPKTKDTTIPNTTMVQTTARKSTTASPRILTQKPKFSAPTKKPKTSTLKPQTPAPKPTFKPVMTNPPILRRHQSTIGTVYPTLGQSSTPRPHYITTLKLNPETTPRRTRPPTTLRPSTKQPHASGNTNPYWTASITTTTTRPVYWTSDSLKTSLPTDSPHKRGRGKGKKNGKRRHKGSRRRYRNGQVRLVSPDLNRSDRGRVEIFVRGEWGTVCDDLFDNKAATVVCKQLGFAIALRVAKPGEMGRLATNFRILLDDVECEGTERTLLHCKHATVGKHNCSHAEDVGVVCGSKEEHAVK